MDLLDELRPIAAEDEAPTAPRPDPWSDARRLAPHDDLVRVIDLTQGLQYFVAIPRPRKEARDYRGHAHLATDGGTHIVGLPQTNDRYAADANHKQAIAAADAAWQPIA